MKKFITFMLAALMAVTATLTLVGCGEEETHTHTFSSEWASDASGHWHAATCEHDLVQDKGEHSFANGRCTVCGYADPNANQGGSGSSGSGDGEGGKEQARREVTADEWSRAFNLGDNFTVKISTRIYVDNRTINNEYMYDGDKRSAQVWENNEGKGHFTYLHFQSATEIWRYYIKTISLTGPAYTKTNYYNSGDYTTMENLRKSTLAEGAFTETVDYLKENFANMYFENNRYGKIETAIVHTSEYTIRMTTNAVEFENGKLKKLDYSVRSNRAGEVTDRSTTVTITNVGSTEVSLPTSFKEEAYTNEYMTTAAYWQSEAVNFDKNQFKYIADMTDKQGVSSHVEDWLDRDKSYSNYSSDYFEKINYLYFENSATIWEYTEKDGKWSRQNIIGDCVYDSFDAKKQAVISSFKFFLTALDGKFNNAKYDRTAKSYVIEDVAVHYVSPAAPAETADYSVDYELKFRDNALIDVDIKVTDADYPDEGVFARAEIECGTIAYFTLPTIDDEDESGITQKQWSDAVAMNYTKLQITETVFGENDVEYFNDYSFADGKMRHGSGAVRLESEEYIHYDEDGTKWQYVPVSGYWAKVNLSEGAAISDWEPDTYEGMVAFYVNKFKRNFADAIIKAFDKKSYDESTQAYTVVVTVTVGDEAGDTVPYETQLTAMLRFVDGVFEGMAYTFDDCDGKSVEVVFVGFGTTEVNLPTEGSACEFGGGTDPGTIPEQYAITEEQWNNFRNNNGCYDFHSGNLICTVPVQDNSAETVEFTAQSYQLRFDDKSFDNGLVGYYRPEFNDFVWYEMTQETIYKNYYDKNSGWVREEVGYGDSGENFAMCYGEKTMEIKNFIFGLIASVEYSQIRYDSGSQSYTFETDEFIYSNDSSGVKSAPSHARVDIKFVHGKFTQLSLMANCTFDGYDGNVPMQVIIDEIDLYSSGVPWK